MISNLSECRGTLPGEVKEDTAARGHKRKADATNLSIEETFAKLLKENRARFTVTSKK